MSYKSLVAAAAIIVATPAFAQGHGGGHGGPPGAGGSPAGGMSQGPMNASPTGIMNANPNSVLSTGTTTAPTSTMTTTTNTGTNASTNSQATVHSQGPAPCITDRHCPCEREQRPCPRRRRGHHAAWINDRPGGQQQWWNASRHSDSGHHRPERYHPRGCGHFDKRQDLYAVALDAQHFRERRDDDQHQHRRLTSAFCKGLRASARGPFWIRPDGPPSRPGSSPGPLSRLLSQSLSP